MPGTTTVYALPYQDLDDAPDGPDLGQDLAEAVEAELVRIDAVWVEGSRTVDVGNIAAGAITEIEIAVTGATVGDPCYVGPPATIEAGLTWSPYVSAAGYVRIRVHNTTGGAINPANATWTVRVST